MIRYFALATMLVLAAALAATAYVNRELIRIRIASVYVPMTPKPADASADDARVRAPFRGDAPWALSALPECLTQIEEDKGSLTFVRAHLPHGSVAVHVPATLTYGNCVIRAGDGVADVERGPDRFHIPPYVRFYSAPGKLILLHQDGGRGEMRIYQRSVPTSQ